MPYGKKTVDGEICVFRKNEDGELFGDSLGCHESDDKANAQMAALYANEPGAQKKDMGDDWLDERPDSLKAVWSRAMINDLPDSAFLFIESGGEKDEGGKTVPRSLRHFPYRDAGGKIDLPHLRNAIARIPQSNARGLNKEAVQEKARRLLAPSQKKDADNALCIKALGGNRIGGYAVLWGDESRKDLVGEWFTPQTEGYAEIYEALGKLPWLFHHGGDETVKAAVAGIVDILVPDEMGMWYEAQLRKANHYIDEIKRLIQDGKLWTSSGTLPAARKVAPTGEIQRWPFTEISGTTVPAEWRMMERPIQEVKAAYKAIGLDFPDDEDADKGAEEARQLRIQTGLGRLKLLEMERQALNLTDSTE